MKRYLPLAALFIALLLALLGWRTTSSLIAREYRRPQTVSLRWKTQALTAGDCRRLEEPAQDEAPPVYAAWAGGERLLVEPRNGREELAQALLVRGEISLLLPQETVLGNLPQSNLECAVSEDLCYELFGSADAAGQTLRMEGRDYTVSGMLRDLRRTVVFLQPQQEAFSALELAVPQGKNAYAAAEDFLSRYALPEPDGVQSHAGHFRLSGLGEWIPSRWSDFEHWSTLLRQAKERRQALGALPLCEPDRLRKEAVNEVWLSIAASLAMSAAALLLLVRELRRLKEQV
ncbi:ABC transporter permease [Harryflintia acetispora]|uniref:Uncharacterized protein n=1 Tax=Harryflintia acetispora TaxID=1849041 RepID=A0A9X8UJY4_9FIRM|nr:ABC transporter permease [Harryflintia acetispora]TCL44076.1 hypothetical protein EDD78_103113 [Harryflintia acetispora]